MMQDLNFHQLKVFLEVVRQGSFSHAAEALFISQPSVSIQVKQLEKAMGVALIDRSAGKMRLTDEGQMVCDYARRIFGLADELKTALEKVDALESGRITVGASTTIGEYLLPRVMGRFRQRYPGIRLGLEIANTREITERIIDRRLHLGVVGDAVDGESLAVQPYRSDEIVLIAAPEHRIAGTPELSFAEIAAEGFIVREVGSATRCVAENTLRQLGVQMQIAMELGSNEAVKQAVAANLGIGVISRYAVASEHLRGQLCILDVADFQCTRQLSIIYVRDRRLTKAEKAFLGILQEPPVDLE